MDETQIARKRPDGTTQSIGEHTKNVAEKMAAVSRYPNTSRLIAHLHDLGKLSSAFQNYIKNGGERGSVIHAWQGAFLADELFRDKDASARLLKEIVGFCVSSHHNHLEDGVSPDGRTDYFDKFSKTADAKYFYNEVKERLTEREKAALQSLFADAKLEMNSLLAEIKATYHTYSSSNFAIGLVVKFLFSLLVDADRLDAYLFEAEESQPKQAPDWGEIIEIFERYITAFPTTTEMDRIRQAVSEKCRLAAGRETGIYQLSVPTGGGKTLSSFRFALHHCKAHGKKRIIYVIPYLSIIEQTAHALRESLKLTEEDGMIFEHHSDLMEPEDECAAQIRAMASARWDSLVIVTTMVQFIESVMSDKSGKLRKFSAMADSVIIFDEIQAMPPKMIHCFNEVVTFLSALCSTTVLLCSATQPPLEDTPRANLRLHPDAKLLDCAEAFKGIKRAQVVAKEEMDCQSASDFIFEKANENGDCLVIVNTKKTALEIYQRLKDKAAGFEALHLSTSMCPSHRKSTLQGLRNSLSEGKKLSASPPSSSRQVWIFLFAASCVLWRDLIRWHRLLGDATGMAKAAARKMYMSSP
jgi:CRISPR-associated endonuclease/helicase Cas3